MRISVWLLFGVWADAQDVGPEGPSPPRDLSPFFLLGLEQHPDLRITQQNADGDKG